KPNANIHPITTPIILTITTPPLPKSFSFNSLNQQATKPSPPNQYNTPQPATIIPINALNIPITQIPSTITPIIPSPLSPNPQPTRSPLSAYSHYSDIPARTTPTPT
ncbi:hypothetical protein, partial [Staphylococcus epidermidis]|uniref:hypothetical protein n=1 Tax=Staphylococcus epidermidis TaxID=1282 RepID=UPI001C92EC2C